MLIKRKSGETSRGKLHALTSGLASGTIDRRTFLKRSGLAVGGLAAVGSIQLGSVRKAAAQRAPGAPIEIRKNICTHCSVGCTVTAEVQNGVWVGQEPSWESPINRGTLRQGRFGARDRARGPPAEIPDEARRRPVAAPLLGPGDQRDRRQAERHPGEVRRRFRVLARLREVLQRGRLSVPQVRRLLGHELRRPPGAHLPFDHRGGRGEHLGLRRTDQFLQRSAQFQDDAPPRLERGRGAPVSLQHLLSGEGDQPRRT